MHAFALLLDGLSTQPSRLGKLRLIRDYFETAPDPDRGYGLAALTGELGFAEAKPGAIRALIEERTDPVLFRLSYDYVGDLAETVALLWPGQDGGSAPALSEVVETLQGISRIRLPSVLARWLDRCDATQRWALLKLITGALRVGVSARLAKTAFAEWANQPVSEVEEVWPAQKPPYRALFAWAAGGARPRAEGLVFRPFMLAHALEQTDQDALDLDAHQVEWKWDGIRVQVAAKGGMARLFARSGDDITGGFPDVAEHMDFDAVLDGELLVRDEQGGAAPFNRLQQRLNRKAVTPRMLREHPAFVRLYDMLFDGVEDLRPLPLEARRARLEAWYAAAPRPGFDLSEIVAAPDWESLGAIRDNARAAAMEGLMLKRRDSPYVPGRPKGLWWKWKRDPLTADAVLMYAQRGHGKRSSFYSDFTFGVWSEDGLVPVGKAYFGFTDAELAELDRWVRNNTTERFGPVRAVRPGLVLEVAFDAVQLSTRHKSGLAMRFPRISRIRWDKPAEDADRIEALRALVEVSATPPAAAGH